MGCDVCKGPRARGEGRRCARCRFRLRHAARRLRVVLYALTDEHVLELVDELADRVQVADAPVFKLLRGAALSATDPATASALDVADGWLLDAEVAA